MNQIALQHPLCAPCLLTLELILWILISCPCWFCYHFVYRQNLQLISAETTENLLLRSKQIPQNLSPDLINTLQIRKPSRAVSPGPHYPHTSPSNTPALPVREPTAMGAHLSRTLESRTALLFLNTCHSCPHTLPSSIPTKNKFFSTVNWWNTFFSIPVHKVNQYLFACTWKG